MVGGAVRDLLLGREPHELDFVVEGDALEVARRVGGRVISHERFGTATVELDGVTFDLASARRERYERPGALPEVELGASLREDLERRDFTVNAIALHLKDGELIWLPGAREDLDARRLRVLHDRSFLDDPTRLLRLARYAARLGFEPEERTDRLAAEAVAGGAVDTVTGSRMGAELRLLLQEPQPAALLALERHGLGGRCWTDSRSQPDERRSRDARTPPCARAASPRSPRRSTADDRGAPRPISRSPPTSATSSPAQPPRRTPLDRAATTPSSGALPRASRPRPPRWPAPAATPAAARRWLEDVRHRRLAITGDDIVAAGLYGPAVGEALDRGDGGDARWAAPTRREEQLAAALG